jgi:hypothetical protein
MAGIPFNKESINHDLGSVTRQVYASLDNVRKLKIALDGAPNQTLLDIGFTQNDIDTIRSAFTDLDNLRQIFEGGRNQMTAYDFRTFARRLIGTGLY